MSGESTAPAPALTREDLPCAAFATPFQHPCMAVSEPFTPRKTVFIQGVSQ